MLKFFRADKQNLDALKPFFAVQNLHISDFSIGFQYMWNKYLKPDCAFAGECLIIKEIYAGKTYFHYPISKNGDTYAEIAALEALEGHCRDINLRLHFTNVPRSRLPLLALRYGREVNITNARRWRDYLYRAEDFKTYAGGRYSGQRNHVNKFKKSFPNWEFRVYTEKDFDAAMHFLKEYEAVQHAKQAFLADEEMEEVFDIFPHLQELGLFCGLLTVDGKIVALSVGERCGDMIVVHIEKALRAYEGAYPMVAQQFALAFCGEGVNYLNRMDDAGDRGLRKSKLQYLPSELVDKFNVIPKRAIDGISRLPVIKTERLTLSPVKDADAEVYARLASDTERNRYWGYDWREDYKDGTPPAKYFLDCAREDFKHKAEMPLGIYLGKKLVGEVVLHRFGYTDEVEVGARVLPEAEGQGYAREAVKAYADYALITLGVEKVEAKCFLENVRSEKMLLGAGMRPCGSDETYLYFYKTASM